MFTIKAIIEQPMSPDTFQMWECHSFRAEHSKVNGANGPGQPPFVPPDYDLTMLDADRNIIDIIHVGRDNMQYYQTVYVMNERGKTVQTIQFINRDVPAVLPTLRAAG